MSEELKKEILENYRFFITQSFDKQKIDKYALIRKQKIMKIMDTARDCKEIANDYKDGLYSIQKITTHASEIDLGSISHALCTI